MEPRRFHNESLKLNPKDTMYLDSTGIKASICGGSVGLKRCFPGFKVIFNTLQRNVLGVPSSQSNCRSGEGFPVRLSEFADGFHESLLSTNSQSDWGETSHLCVFVCLSTCASISLWSPHIIMCISNHCYERHLYHFLHINSLVYGWIYALYRILFRTNRN